MLLQIAQDLRQIADRIEGEIVGQSMETPPMNALERFLADLEKVYTKHGLCIDAHMLPNKPIEIIICGFDPVVDMETLRKAHVSASARDQLELNDKPPF